MMRNFVCRNNYVKDQNISGSIVWFDMNNLGVFRFPAQGTLIECNYKVKHTQIFV